MIPTSSTISIRKYTIFTCKFALPHSTHLLSFYRLVLEFPVKEVAEEECRAARWMYHGEAEG